MMLHSAEFDAMERDELRQQARFEARRAAEYARHPMDPEYPDDEGVDSRVCLSCGCHIAPDGTLPCGH